MTHCGRALQVQNLLESYASIDEMRTEMEAASLLKGLVVRNSDSLSKFDASIAALQESDALASEDRTEIRTRLDRLVRDSNDLK